jgi:hypothetical protein
MNSAPGQPLPDRQLQTSTPTNPDRQSEAWHLVETEQILTNLQTSADSGLSDAAVRSNLQQYGLNLLPESSPRSNTNSITASSPRAYTALISSGLINSIGLFWLNGLNLFLYLPLHPHYLTFEFPAENFHFF